MKRDFKGVWIPKDIWLSKELSLIEKCFLVEIDSLDNDPIKGCFASNAYFAEFFNLSESRVANILTDLRKRGYVKQVYFDGRMRGLRCFFQQGSFTENGKADLSKTGKRTSRKREHNNTVDNKEYNKVDNSSFSNEKEPVGKIAEEFERTGEPEPVKIRAKKTPPELRAAPPANYIYQMYEVWAKYVEAKGVPVARTANGNYQMQGKDTKALKDLATWLMNMPGEGTAVQRWEQFIQLAWGKADKFIRNNFTPDMLNSKRMNIVMTLNHQSIKDKEYVEMASQGFDFDAYLRGEIEI